MKSLMIFSTGLLIYLLSACGDPGTVSQALLALPDGSVLEALELENDSLKVRIIPELGGKIVSIKNTEGREFISRSSRPWTRRSYPMKYTDTEFDGIDECFPTLVDCDYPNEPWLSNRIADHGEVCQLPWQKTKGPGISLEVRGKELPYLFKRRAYLAGSSLVLDYTVQNLSDSEMHYLYIFHPLFNGETGCRMEIADETPVYISWSTHSFLGDIGSEKTWQELRSADGKIFKDDQFTTDHGRYYKYFIGPLDRGRAVLHYADGSRVRLSWPADMLPYYSVWCSEGGVDDLHHIAPEPVASRIEDLAEAVKAGEALVLPARGEKNWRIKLKFY